MSFECHHPNCGGCNHCWATKSFYWAISPLEGGLGAMEAGGVSPMRPESRRAARVALTQILRLAGASLQQLDELDAADAAKAEAA